MWRIPPIFEALPLERSTIPAPAIENAIDKKRKFAVEITKVTDPFQAACNICGQDTNEALWISQNWVNDLEVLGYKDQYLNSVETSKTLLDKEEVAAKLLNMAEEKSHNGMFYILEGKDRLKALELYAKIQGYLDTKDKAPNNFIQNTMVVKFVKPNIKEEKVINNEDKPLDNNITPLKVKLVG